jgi:hypothetical protein
MVFDKEHIKKTIKQSHEQIRIFERPSADTSKSLLEIAERLLVMLEMPDRSCALYTDYKKSCQALKDHEAQKGNLQRIIKS